MGKCVVAVSQVVLFRTFSCAALACDVSAGPFDSTEAFFGKSGEKRL